MKRFITYVYEYKEGQKIRGAGYIRVDVRGQRMQMLLNIKVLDLVNNKGKFVLYMKEDSPYEIVLDEITLKEGIYNGRILFDFEEKNISLSNMIGVAIRFEEGTYIASCWQDGEEALVAAGCEFKIEREQEMQMEQATEIGDELIEEAVESISSIKKEEEELQNLQIINYNSMETYRKINLNEIHTLPSRHWHYANNSFLIHGFWNYGYLVLKESMEENKKRMSLGVPGIFEQPEMVMAAYFGFLMFEVLPAQVEKMEIGEVYSDHLSRSEKKNQQAKDGIFGCWFVEL